ncbi:YkgJ family cysteine cluster protein [Peredibacter starrii]|uniref:YkgJ family cysteine cluster protein n=1 Tax=Peredibacter starrii TaxID=28202 RepID=A0AAX4HM97_9BACT|nr:YkgJ family cysteine cluster protein [Peredibacter starrii]WPU64298.1 YkgJ family cysteine cluster protein [Peredibacter starrii]
MNVPAIAKRTFEELKSKSEFLSMVQNIINELQQLSSPITRAKFIHNLIEELNRDVFSNPLVEQLSPCKMGCSACCHTQVSVTQDEAALMALLVREGIGIDLDLLELQAIAKNDSDEFYKIPYSKRACVFLDENGACRIYKNRPSVCRTNAVIGEIDQCDTSSEIKPTRLIKTPKSDLVIYASFMDAEDSGTLPYMLSKVISAE